VDITEDLAEFFRAGEFAVDATWSQGPATIQVLFGNSASDPLRGAARSSRPTATVRTAQVPGVAPGQTLTIAAVVYTIAPGGVEHNGTGLTILTLAKA
jgi:hypothetical protein